MLSYALRKRERERVLNASAPELCLGWVLTFGTPYSSSITLLYMIFFGQAQSSKWALVFSMLASLC